MDGFAFDALARSLTIAGSRRRALRVLAGSLLGGTLAPVLGQTETDAHDPSKKCKKKSGKPKKACLKKAKKHNATHTTPPPPGPVVHVFEIPDRYTFTAPQAGTVRVEVLAGAGGRGGDGDAAAK